MPAYASLCQLEALAAVACLGDHVSLFEEIGDGGDYLTLIAGVRGDGSDKIAEGDVWLRILWKTLGGVRLFHSSGLLFLMSKTGSACKMFKIVQNELQVPKKMLPP